MHMNPFFINFNHTVNHTVGVLFGGGSVGGGGRGR